MLLHSAKAGTRLHLEPAQLVIDALPGGLIQHSSIVNDIVCGGLGLVQDVKLVCQSITGAQQQRCCCSSLQVGILSLDEFARASTYLSHK